MPMLFLILWVSFVWALGPSVAPSDGSAATGAAEPAWTALAEPLPVLPDAGALAAELDTAWALRRELNNERASAIVARLVTELRPTLDSRQRDLLQRTLFLQGLLEIEAAGDIGRLRDPAEVGALRIPRPWAAAIALSPGASAPADTDIRYAVHAYDEARTLLTAQQGTPIDVSAAGLDVRIDGEPVIGELRVLPGLHTLSFHPPGAPPRALTFRIGPGNGGHQVAELTASYEALSAFVDSGAMPPAAVRLALHQRLGTPAAQVRTPTGVRTLWLVDGLARWGKPRLSVGVSGGASMLAGAWADTPAGCDGIDAGDKAVVPLSGLAAATLGPWRARAGIGFIAPVDDAGFATASTINCDGHDVPGATGALLWGHASLARRIAVGRGEFDIGLRAGGSPAFAFADAVLTVPVLVRRSVAIELAAHGGGFLNGWSGEGDRSGFLGGVDTHFLFGAR